MPAGITDPRAAALEISSLRTDNGLRLQYLETGRWRRDFLAAWMTGSGRLQVLVEGSVGAAKIKSRLGRVVTS